MCLGVLRWILYLLTWRSLLSYATLPSPLIWQCNSIRCCHNVKCRLRDNIFHCPRQEYSAILSFEAPAAEASMLLCAVVMDAIRMILDPVTGEFLEYSGNFLMMSIVTSFAACDLSIPSTRSEGIPVPYPRHVYSSHVWGTYLFWRLTESGLGLSERKWRV